jgi:hypothetical protein
LAISQVSADHYVGTPPLFSRTIRSPAMEVLE